METATSLVINQLAEYLRGLTQRLDSGAGWYGEFLRRDPEGVRACIEGRAMVPWDVLESLLGDLAAARGAEFAERETVYAARLRAAAVTAWDRLPGGEAELRSLLAASTVQRADSEAAVRHLAARLSSTADPAEADALSLELSWTRDDATRAASRQADLTTRLSAVSPPGEAHRIPAGAPAGGARPGPAAPGPVGPRAPGPGPAGHPVPGWEGPVGAGFPGRPPEAPAPGPAAPLGAGAAGEAGPEGAGDRGPEGGSRAPAGEPLPGVPRQRAHEAERPVGRAEGRWLRGGRRSGGARYAGSAAPEPPAPTLPDLGRPARGAEPESGLPAPRGARFGRAADPAPQGARPRPEPAPAPQTGTHPAPHDPARGTGAPAPAASPYGPGGSAAGRYPEPPAGAPAPDGFRHGPGGSAAGQYPEPPAGAPAPAASPYGPGGPAAGQYPEPPAGGAEADPVRGVVGRLLALRAHHRTGEAHALLCEAAAWPAERLPGLAAELNRAGLAADWATLLWEAASLPPERLAALAAALDEAGREADCDRLLRQGMARPAAEIADAALALGQAGRDREAGVLLAAFVDVRTAEEAAALARRAPQWFAPRLLRAARTLPGARHRDLVHALRVAGVATA
ncbi:hypothetical protein [Streptomyces sp. NPDC091371]|uniref:hypothetical protein n=1 Tax=Streptomyces sp. NPDC091371 TaxID=3155303 RepID=UPI003449DCD6